MALISYYMISNNDRKIFSSSDGLEVFHRKPGARYKEKGALCVVAFIL